MVTRRDFLAAGLAGIGGLLVAGKSGEVRAQAKPEGAKKSGTELILLGTMGGGAGPFETGVPRPRQLSRTINSTSSTAETAWPGRPFWQGASYGS